MEGSWLSGWTADAVGFFREDNPVEVKTRGKSNPEVPLANKKCRPDPPFP